MKQKPVIDLHPSEWSHEKKREPIFGPGGGYFFLMFFLGFPISALATLLVTGELPYWLQHFLG